MSIDASLCIVKPNKRQIWTQPRKFWTRDPGNCNFDCNSINNCPSGFSFINAIQNNQKNFRKLVLENKVPPKGGSSSMSNVDGRLTKTSFYNYLSNVKSNPYYQYQTYATQKADGTYTNPNTQEEKFKIVKIFNNPAILACDKSNKN